MDAIEHAAYPVCRDFLDQSAILFLTMNKQSIIRSANTYARQQLGEEIIGKRFEAIILDFYNTFDPSLLNHASDKIYPLNVKRKTGLPQTFQFRFRSSDHHIFALGELDTEELETVRNKVLTLNEELNNISRELHKTNARLELLNHEKNQFLGMAAHDLRKPIGLVLTYSDFLIDEARNQLSSEHLDFLHTIQKSCSFMKRLVDDFLDVSAIEAGKFDLERQHVNIVDLLKQALTLNLLQASKKGVKIEVNTDPDIPILFVDSSKIEQVIINLVSNAIEHTFKLTQVTVKVQKEDDAIVFSVADQGPGIPKTEINRLFKPFVKTSVKKEGGEKSTGLGMLITRKIIEAHSGQIWVDEQVSRGARIIFTLPITGEIDG